MGVIEESVGRRELSAVQKREESRRLGPKKEKDLMPSFFL